MLNIQRFLILVPLALFAAVPQAKQSKGRVGYVNILVLIQKLPQGKAYIALDTKAKKDLSSRLARLKRVKNQAGSSPTAAKRNLIKEIEKNYIKTQKNYNSQLKKTFAPLSKKIDAAIRKTAAANGYSVLFDQQVAAKSNLIIYADKRVNLTNAVMKNLK